MLARIFWTLFTIESVGYGVIFVAPPLMVGLPLAIEPGNALRPRHDEAAEIPVEMLKIQAEYAADIEPQ